MVSAVCVYAGDSKIRIRLAIWEIMYFYYTFFVFVYKLAIAEIQIGRGYWCKHAKTVVRLGVLRSKICQCISNVIGFILDWVVSCDYHGHGDWLFTETLLWIFAFWEYTVVLTNSIVRTFSVTINC